LHVQGDIAGTLFTSDQATGLAAGRLTELQGRDHHRLVWRTVEGNLSREVGWLERLPARIGSWTLTRDSGDLPAGRWLLLEPADKRIMKDDLAYLSAVLRFGTDGVPTPGLSVSFHDDSKDLSHAGIYAWQYHRKRWRYWGSAGDVVGAVSAEVDYLTPLVVARDLKPPAIGRSSWHGYFTGRRQVIPLRDRASGIDADSLEVTQSGQPVAHHYDRDRGWIVIEDRINGSFEVTVRDRSGREASANVRLP